MSNSVMQEKSANDRKTGLEETRNSTYLSQRPESDHKATNRVAFLLLTPFSPFLAYLLANTFIFIWGERRPKGALLAQEATQRAVVLAAIAQ